jgi:hypothetical protein
MAQINNSDLTRELIVGAKINTSVNLTPSQLAEKVVPTMEVNPKLLRETRVVKSESCVNSTSETIYTTSKDKDFYLTGFILTNIKDSSATSISSFIRAYVMGEFIDFGQIAGITLTEQSGQITFNLPNPLKLDRNSVISVRNNTNTANVSTWASIFGYEVEE